MKYLLRVLFGLVLAAAVVFLMSRVISWQDALQSVRALHWTSIAIIIGTVCMISLAKATRFFFILRYEHLNVSFWNTIRIFFASQAFTPLPGSEVARAMLFKKELDGHLKDLIGPVYFQALMELLTAVLLGIFASMFIKLPLGWLFVGLWVLLAILLAVIACSKQLPRFFDLLKRCGMTFAWVDKAQMALQHYARLISSKGKINVRRFWVLVIGIGLLAHAVSGGLLWYIAQNQGVHISIFQSLFAAALAVLIQGALSFIPGGLGVTEGGLVGILTGFGVPWQSTIIITLLYRAATLVLPIVVAFFFLIFLYGRNVFRSAPQSSV